MFGNSVTIYFDWTWSKSQYT